MVSRTSKSAIEANVISEEMAQTFAQAIVKVITDKKIDTTVGSSLALNQIAHEIDMLLGLVKLKKPKAKELMEYVANCKSESNLDEAQILANSPFDLSEFATVVYGSTKGKGAQSKKVCSIKVAAAYKGEILSVTITPSTPGFIRLLNQLQREAEAKDEKEAKQKTTASFFWSRSGGLSSLFK